MSISYIRVKLVSPQKVLTWSERKLPSGDILGRVENSLWYSYFIIYIFLVISLISLIYFNNRNNFLISINSLTFDL